MGKIFCIIGKSSSGYDLQKAFTVSPTGFKDDCAVYDTPDPCR